MYKKFRLAWPFLLPGLAGLLIFYGIPFVGGIWYSVTDGKVQNAFVGLENYISVWNNTMFQMGLKNTMELSLICAPLLFLLSFVLAAGLHRIRPAGGFFRSGVLLPYLMPSSAILLIWLIWFDFRGPVNRLLVALGGTRVDWLVGPEARLPVILLFLWKNLGFCVVIFMSALQSIPESLYEYATLEGASFMKQTFRITLPLMKSSILAVLMLGFIYTFRAFDLMYIMTKGGPLNSTDVLGTYSYMLSFTQFKFSKGSAATMVLFFCLFVVGMFYLHLLRKEDK